MVGNDMRDGSVDELTGWLFDGNYLERYIDLSTGLSGLGELGQVVAQLPKIGQKHVRMAMADPKAAPIVRELLKQRPVEDALAKQAESDIEEMAHPTGKVIVFKDIARKIAPKIKAVENAVVAAMPNKNTEEGEIARNIIAKSDNPDRDLERFYQEVAADAAGVPILDESGEVESWTSLDGLGKASKAWRRWKKVAKVLKVVGIAAAAVVAAPYVVAGAKVVGGAIIGGVKSIFGGGAPAPGVTTGPMPPEGGVDTSVTTGPTPPTPEAPTWQGPVQPEKGVEIPWGKLATLGVQVVKYKQAQARAKAANNPAEAAQQDQAAQQVHQQAVDSLVQQGVPQAQAEQYVQQAEQEAQAQMPAPPPSGGGAPPGAPGTPSKVAEAGFPVLPLIIVGGVVLIAMSGKGGSSRVRRNPRRYYRSQRRRRSA